MKKIYQSVIVCIFIFIKTNTAAGQTFSITFDLPELYKKNQLEAISGEVRWFIEDGKQGISISESQSYGIVWLRGIEFSNGVIEVDIRFSVNDRQSLAGIAFHGIDNDTFDAVYFRPFNILSGDPEQRNNSILYISHSEDRSTVLQEGSTVISENRETISTVEDGWFHVRISVQNLRITVYINDSPEPDLTVNKLNDRRLGRIGFLTGYNSGSYFANLKLIIRKQDNFK